jgi:hypothetical protein
MTAVEWKCVRQWADNIHDIRHIGLRSTCWQTLEICVATADWFACNPSIPLLSNRIKINSNQVQHSKNSNTIYGWTARLGVTVLCMAATSCISTMYVSVSSHTGWPKFPIQLYWTILKSIVCKLTCKGREYSGQSVRKIGLLTNEIEKAFERRSRTNGSSINKQCVLPTNACPLTGSWASDGI